MRLNVGILAAALFAPVAPVFAQFPTQYPAGQYPPTTYPPGGQYPPGQYPPGGQYPGGSYPPGTYPDTYPTRMPGGVPVNLPVPNIKLPKKGDKSGDKGGARQEQAKVTVASVDGTLRRLREKDLLLETARHAVLRFRLIAKTRFENKAGEPVRDSLLHPGDQVSVLVSPDDEETAVRIVLARSGSSSDRAAAEKPVEEASIRAPRAEDLSKPRSISSREAASAESAPVIEEDHKAETAAPASDSAPGARPAPEPTAEPDSLKSKSGGNSDQDMIEGARDAASAFSSTLPNYLVQQLTIRYFSPGSPPRWQLIDQVTADLAYVDGKEDYRNFRIDGKPVDRPEQSGSWSTGEFSTTLEDILSRVTNAKFHRRGEQKMAGRDAVVFDYTVAQTNSHWTVVAPDDRRYNPPYEGAIWVDQGTHRVLRIEQRTSSMPSGWPYRNLETVLEYGYARIDQKTYLLPDRAEVVACMSGSGTCTRNVIEFRNYRKFTTDSNISFGR